MKESVVVVCADKNIEIGLHVTLYSLLRSTMASTKIYFVQKGYSELDLERLKVTLNPFAERYTLIPIAFDDAKFLGLRGLHGNRMPYAKLILADIIHEDRVIFLDSDLVVNLDIHELFEEDLNGFLLGAAGGAKIGWCLERDFYVSLGFDMDAPYFSSGVMLLDLAGWRKDQMSDRCLDVAGKYASLLRNTDQQVLNTVYYKNFMGLKASYNHVLWPSTPKIGEPEEKIYHFGGVPKPWDLFGESLNGNAKLYLDVLEKTSFRGWRSWKSLRYSTVQRFLRTPRSYYALAKKILIK